MKKKFDLKSFVCGVLVMVLIVTLAFPVSAAYTSKTISGLTGIKVYIDDRLFTPRDPNGKVVEPFVADGTTYLPMRAIAEALGVTVQWDAKTQSAYVGQHSSTSPAVYLKDLDYFAGTETLNTAASDQDSFGNTHYNCILPASYIGSWNRKYQLNGRYSKMTGTTYQRYIHRSQIIYTGIGYEIYGDGKLLYSESIAEKTVGYVPKSFTIDLTGVLELEVKYNGNSGYSDSNQGNNLALGDCGLWT